MERDLSAKGHLFDITNFHQQLKLPVEFIYNNAIDGF